MITLRKADYGHGLNRWAENSAGILATIHQHPNWQREKLPDRWNVCWRTGRVDWHSTLKEAQDNVLKGPP